MLPNNWIVPQLRAEEVHVWRQKLDLPPTSVEQFGVFLTADEQNRARRFHFEVDRTEFVVSRGTLRALLGSYQCTPAGELRFAYSEYGRPRLADNANSEPIEFNISHSGGVVLLAFSRLHSLGIDVEKVRTNFDSLEIAESYFSQSERAVLRGIPVDARQEAFFRCWTRKEAFIKALGEGLSHPLDAFDVSLAPGVPAALLATRPNGWEATRWAILDVAVPNGYVAALAVGIETSVT
jgi:4'-phosphopantetheinyl transferase